MVENLRPSFKPCRIALCGGVVVDSLQHLEHTVNTQVFENKRYGSLRGETKPEPL
jgi:hypothetical protein